MLFSSPTSFKEALDSRKVKALLPTTGSSYDLAKIAAKIRERATFSARTPYIEHLAQIDSVIGRLLEPGAAAPGEGVNEARAREILRDSLRSIGYSPDPAEAGTLKDLGSEQRLNLIVNMNAGFARGYGQWAQGQNGAVLDQWPAQELIRVEYREHPRDWTRRWQDAGGQVFPGGRMVALKNDAIWTAISDFDLPYPPFAYGSGMGVQDVSRGDAEDLRLLGPDDLVAPEDRGFNDDLRADITPPARQSGLFQAIMDSMGDSVEFRDGVLHFKAKA